MALKLIRTRYRAAAPSRSSASARAPMKTFELSQ